MKITDFDTIITLSTRINLDGTLQEDVKGRVDRSIGLYKEQAGLTMTMTGQHDPKDWDAPCTHAEAMARYVIVQGVPEKDVLKEEASLDTVGQAFFVKRDLVLPRGWGKLIVVSSDFHAERVRTIFGFVYGDNFQIEYQWAETELAKDQERLSAEKRSLDTFLRFFAGIKQGNDQDIGNKLFSDHPFYNKKE